MASTINADDGVVSGSAGVKTSADNSGALELQTNGVTAIVISSSQTVSFPATTSLALSGSVTLSTGTPNGMLYLNSSSVITSGSAVVFDGTNMGLGGTPSNWQSGRTAFQITPSSTQGHVVFGGTISNISTNAFVDATDARWEYIGNGLPALYQQDDGRHIFYTAASGTANSAISWSQVMTLNASGNLLVGTTSSSAKFHAKGTTAADVLYRLEPYDNNYASKLLISSTSSGDGGIRYGSGGGNDLDIFSYGPMRFYCGTANISGTVGDERARITATGEVLFSTTDAGLTSGAGFKYLPAGGGADTPYIGLVGSSSSNNEVTYRLYSTGAAAYRFYVGYGGTVYATNTTISSTSDVRLKENIRDLDVGLDAVMALKPRKFDWKPGKGRDKKDDRGFIAQELEQVFPDLIDDWLDPAPEGEEPYKSVRQDLIPVLVKAIQEQQAMIEDLKAKVAALESK